MGSVAVLLLDTHIFLWWLFDDPKLPESLRQRISNPDNPVYVSSASVWEIATKHRLGKLPQAETVARNVPGWIDRAGFQPLPIMPIHAQLAGSWKNNHRDPFDRMLAAQSKIERLPLATLDGALRHFEIEIIE